MTEDEARAARVAWETDEFEQMIEAAVPHEDTAAEPTVEV